MTYPKGKKRGDKLTDSEIDAMTIEDLDKFLYPEMTAQDEKRKRRLIRELLKAI